MRASLPTAHGRLTARSGWLLALEAFGGATGLGEALPLPGFGLESAKRAGAARAGAMRRLVGLEIDSVSTGLSIAEPDLAEAPAARAALDAALAVAGCGPVAVAVAKRVLQEGQDADVRTAHALEQHAFGLVFATVDREEGIAAFLEKRKPDFQGH